MLTMDVSRRPASQTRPAARARSVAQPGMHSVGAVCCAFGLPTPGQRLCPCLEIGLDRLKARSLPGHGWAQIKLGALRERRSRAQLQISLGRALECVRPWNLVNERGQAIDRVGHLLPRVTGLATVRVHGRTAPLPVLPTLSQIAERLPN